LKKPVHVWRILMKKRTVATLLVILALCIVPLLSSCDLLDGVWRLIVGDNGMLVGTWVSNDGYYRYTFDSDDTFVQDYDDDGWETALEGIFDYDHATRKLTLDSGTPWVLDVLLDRDTGRMSMGVDALSGGNTSTFLGTWVGHADLGTFVQTHTWMFTPTAVTYQVLMTGTMAIDYTVTGSVAIDTSARTFTVSDSTDPVKLSNGTYDYVAIDDGVTIADYPAGDLDFFIRQ
jgi:hypothetical protein